MPSNGFSITQGKKDDKEELLCRIVKIETSISNKQIGEEWPA